MLFGRRGSRGRSGDDRARPDAVEFEFLEEVLVVESPSPSMESAASGDRSDGSGERRADGPDDLEFMPTTAVADTAVADPRIDVLLSRMEFLVELVQSRAQFDQTRELQVQKLWDELDEYKQDAHSARMLDLARGVMMVVDKLSGSDADLIPADHIRDELVEHLAAVGVVPIAGEVGSVGAPTEVVVRLIDPDDADDVRLWQEGYEYGGRLVRPRQIEQKEPR